MNFHYYNRILSKFLQTPTLLFRLHFTPSLKNSLLDKRWKLLDHFINIQIKVVSLFEELQNVKYLKIIKGRTSEYGIKLKTIDYI